MTLHLATARFLIRKTEIVKDMQRLSSGDFWWYNFDVYQYVFPQWPLNVTKTSNINSNNLTIELLKKKGSFIKFLYKAMPPYRIQFNKKRVLEIEGQLNEYKNRADQLRKLSFKIESVYTDGI